jgi:hypothetical protein
MTPSRSLSLLRFALEARDTALAVALARAIGPAADRELRAMPRRRAVRTPGPLLVALDALASA